MPFPIEVIVSDDCSSDGTRGLVAEYARAHPELIKPLFPDRHLGMNPLFRRALGTARGDYLALLDGDDYWTSSDKLRRQVALLDSGPELTGCFHDARVVFEDDPRPDGRYVPGPKKERFELGDLLRLCYPPTLSVLFRRKVLAHVPDWSFDLAWADWLIWIFATRQGPFAYIDEAMGVYRKHAGGYFSSQDRSSQLEEDLRLYQRLRDELPDQSDLIERCIIQRSCELAVEECGLPYDSPVVVVGKFDDPRPPFNGRTTRYLDASPGGSAAEASDEQPLVERLERLCRKDAAPGKPFSHPRAAPRESVGTSCFVVVPSSSRAGLQQQREFAAGLSREGSMVWDGTRCAIYELSKATAAVSPDRDRGDPARSPLAEIVDVSSAEPPDERVHGRIGRPSVGSVVDPSAVRMVGWALGQEEPVAGVEIEADGRVIWQGSVGVERQDLAKAFPDFGWARNAGFVGNVDVLDALTEGRVDFETKAVLGDGSRAPIGTISLTRSQANRSRARWRTRSEPRYIYAHSHAPSTGTGAAAGSIHPPKPLNGLPNSVTQSDRLSPHPGHYGNNETVAGTVLDRISTPWPMRARRLLQWPLTSASCKVSHRWVAALQSDGKPSPRCVRRVRPFRASSL